MKFDTLDARMRALETADDYRVPPERYIVVRLDGRNFTTLTRKAHDFQAPYDSRFRDLMTRTAKHLMNCGFNAIYAYHQSDEISLLLHPRDDTFGRKSRKLLSILAGEASAAFSVALGSHAVFDARLSPLPDVEHLQDYFRWRQADARRNAVNSHCYWCLRQQNKSPAQVQQALLNLATPAKKDLLQTLGVDYAKLPDWQKNGVGLYWVAYDKIATDPRNGNSVTTERRELKTDLSLPSRERYAEFVQDRLLGGCK